MNRGSDSISTVISSFLFYILPTFFQAIIVSVVFWKLVEMPMIAVSTLIAIVLDEATSALDSKTEKEIQRNIASICSGRTTILIAHRLSTARKADQIIVLNEGCIAEIGSHGDLLDRDGIYAEMWKLQTDTNDETNEETMK